MTMVRLGPNKIGVPLLKHKDSLLDSQIHLFLHFSHDLFYILPFFLMLNEIILFQILCRPLKYLLFSLMKVRIVRFIHYGPCSINGLKFSKILFFETFYITIGHLVFVAFIHFIHISTWNVCGKNLGPKKLFKHSLRVLELFLSSLNKVMDFFQRLGRNL